MERVTKKLDTNAKQDYKDFLYERFGVSLSEEGLEPNRERANADAVFEPSDKFSICSRYHESLSQIAEDRRIERSENPFEDEYTIRHPAESRKIAISEFKDEMPEDFSAEEYIV